MTSDHTTHIAYRPQYLDCTSFVDEIVMQYQEEEEQYTFWLLIRVNRF
jgi:hypothetical protein